MSGVPSTQFREALAGLACAVVVATARDPEGTPHGLTATSFRSVSLDPPLVSVCIARGASAYAAFASCTEFAVSILAAEQAAVAERFATPGAERFPPDGGMVATPKLALPGVGGALCLMDCVVRHRYGGGDHVILVGEVVSTQPRAEPGGDPLLYFERSYRTIRSLSCQGTISAPARSA